MKTDRIKAAADTPYLFLLRAYLFLSLLIVMPAAIGDEVRFVLDIRAAAEQLINSPCKDTECDVRAQPYIKKAFEQIRNELPGTETYTVDSSLWQPLEGVSGGLLFDGSSFEAIGLLPGYEGSIQVDDCAVNYSVDLNSHVREGRLRHVDILINFTSTGCDCDATVPDDVAWFNVTKMARFNLEYDNNRYISLQPNADSLRCASRSECGCALDQEGAEVLPQPRQEDPIPYADPPPSAAPLDFFIELNPRAVVDAAINQPCPTERPCDKAAQTLRTFALHNIAARVPTRLDIPPIAVVGRDNLRQAYDDWWDKTHRWGQFPEGSRIYGRLATPAGELTYGVELEISPSRDTEVGGWTVPLKGKLYVEGNCSCWPDGPGAENVDYIIYEFEIEFEASLWTAAAGDSGRENWGFEFFPPVGDDPGMSCRFRASCCTMRDEERDPVPPLAGDSLVLEWDSAEWCTYGGGKVILPVGGGGVTLFPPGFTPLPPNPPGGGDGTSTPPPTEGGGEDGGGTPVPPDDGGDGSVPVPIPTGDDDDDSDDEGDPPTMPPTDGDDDDGTGEPPQRPDGPDDPDDADDPDDPDQPDEPDEPDEPSPPVANLTIKATSTTLAQGGAAAGAGMLVQINTGEPEQVAGDPDAERDEETGARDGELSGTLDENGELLIEVPAALVAVLGQDVIEFDVTPYTGRVLAFDGDVAADDVLDDTLLPYVQPAVVLDGTTYLPLLIPDALVTGLQGAIDAADSIGVEVNVCIDPKPLSDPYFGTRGSWDQPYADQWAIQRVGFTDDKDSTWTRLKPKGEPVIVAVIDTGLDWNHREISWDSLWRNPGEIPANGIDDDGNGYVDDTIGWDFWDNDRKPWDTDGHGTFVAGILFARADNDEGIAGIARHAKLMVLKAMNGFGHTRASNVAQAIQYAADNGARVINLSLGGPGESTVVSKAIDYAHARGVVVVVAAGNEATPAENQSVAGAPNALTVAATGINDKRAIYSNYGAGIDLAAPGDDVLSLRARRTDLLKNIPDVAYEAEAAFVGDDRRYYRASGTSFAAPMVAGAAALVLAKDPNLSADEVMRVLKQSARDVDTPGVDHFTGYGLLDVNAALRADPRFYLEANISGVAVAERDGKQVLVVNGSMDADRFKGATVSIGQGAEPTTWAMVTEYKKPLTGELAGIPATSFAGAKVWIIRLQVEHRNGEMREFRFRLALG